MKAKTNREAEIETEAHGEHTQRVRERGRERETRKVIRADRVRILVEVTIQKNGFRNTRKQRFNDSHIRVTRSRFGNTHSVWMLVMLDAWIDIKKPTTKYYENMSSNASSHLVVASLFNFQPFFIFLFLACGRVFIHTKRQWNSHRQSARQRERERKNNKKCEL